MIKAISAKFHTNINYPVKNKIPVSFQTGKTVFSDIPFYVSFRGKKDSFENMLKNKYGFSSEQSDFITRNHINGFENLNPADFDNNIADLYLSPKQKESFLKNRRLLNLEESFGAVAYELNDEQIQNYKSLKSKYPALSLIELILITKSGLSEEQISKFTEIKSQRVNKGVLPVDEAVICAKADLDSEKVEQFVKLRNKTKDLRSDSVRETGGVPSFPVQYVLDCVISGKSEEEIDEEDEIFELGKSSSNPVELISALSKEQRVRYQTVDFKPTEEEYWEYQNYITGNANEENIPYEFLTETFRYTLSSYSDEQFDMYNKLVNEGMNKYLAVSIAPRFSSEKFSEFKNLISEGKTPTEALNSLNEYPEELGEIDKASVEEKMCILTEWFKLHENELYSKKADSEFTPQQKEKYYKLLNDGYKCSLAYNLAMLTERQYSKYQNFPEDIKQLPWAVDLSKLSDKEFKKYQELSDDSDFILALHHYTLGYEKYNPLEITKLSDEKTERFFRLKRNAEEKDILSICSLTFSLLFDIVNNSSLNSFSPEILEKLPDNIWYLANTGENKEVYDTISTAVLKVRENNLNLKPIKTPDSDIAGNIEGKGFSVNIQKSNINGKTIFVIKDNNSSERFVSYKGAVVRVDCCCNFEDKKSNFNSHCNILPEKQNKVLAKAAGLFAFNLFDEKNQRPVISSQMGDIPPLYSANLSTDETKRYYGSLMTSLKNNDKLNAHNLLKIMPLDSVLSVNSCTTEGNGNMLYSVSSEWKDKDGKNWQLRIHSQDLKYPPSEKDSNWIMRLGYEENGELHYIQLENNSYNFDGVHSGIESSKSHIEIPTPVENSLINNIDFQKTVRSLSSDYSKSDNLTAITEDLNINSGVTTDKERAEKIISFCLANPFQYLRYKDTVDELRKNSGRISLS